MSVLDLDDAKSHLNITGSSHDTELQEFIDAAESAIAARVGPLAAEERTIRVRSNGGSLVLPGPFVSLTSVTSASGSALTVGDLYTDPLAGVVGYSDGYTTIANDVYDVVYMAGREECPPDLLLAVKELVRHLWETQRGPTSRPGSRTSDSASNTLPGAGYLLPFRVQQLLEPYMTIGFA